MNGRSPFQRVVAAHQPNFFPWLGWFDKLRKADVFVILDDVQFPRGGRCWGNRVRFVAEGKEQWLTAPLSHSRHAPLRFNEVLLASGDWRMRMARRLEAAYAKAPFFRKLMPMARELLENPSDNLVEYNMAALAGLADLLGLDHNRLIRASSFGLSSSATQRLVDLTKAAGGDAYLCGGGAEGYQDDAAFARHGLGLIYQNFNHPEYGRQGAPFFSGLTVLDALFHAGPEATRTFLRPLPGSGPGGEPSLQERHHDDTAQVL